MLHVFRISRFRTLTSALIIPLSWLSAFNLFSGLLFTDTLLLAIAAFQYNGTIAQSSGFMKNTSLKRQRNLDSRSGVIN